MKVLIILLSISFNLYASETDEAISGVQKAILAYPQVKKLKRSLEKKAFEYVPLERETAGVIGAFAISAIKGRVDTKAIKKMDIKFIGFNMRPDIQYNLRTGETRGLVNLHLGF